jgi:centromeric protein E
MDATVAVAIRLRPLVSESAPEKTTPPSGRTGRRRQEGESAGWSTSSNGLVQKDVAKPISGRHLFSFDSIFDGADGTAKVYHEVGKPIVTAVARARHGTIFAYGPTGSGKTFTMFGDTKQPGIVQMAVQDLLDHMKLNRSDWDSMLNAQFFEVYNEQIRDLLVETNLNECRLESDDLRCNEATGASFRNYGKVDACEKCMETMEDVESLLLRGHRNRASAATSLNAHSSRSHAIVRLLLESRSKSNSGVVRRSVLNLVDLAGSENSKHAGISGVQKRETGNINQRYDIERILRNVSALLRFV